MVNKMKIKTTNWIEESLSNCFHDGKYFTLYDNLHGILLPGNCCVMDIDQAEYRYINKKRTIVALIEVKESEGNKEQTRESMFNPELLKKQLIKWNEQLGIMYALAEKNNVDSYLVIHTSDCQYFIVYILDKNEIYGEFTREEYFGNFLKNLKPRNN